MLMHRLDVLAMNSPHRRWIIDRVTASYYREFFNDVIDKKVLEIGCGAGFGTEVIKKYFSPKSIEATDIDPRMIALAKKNIHDQTINFSVADATKLPYKSNSFDAIFDYCAIHHIPSPRWKDCVRELYRVLSPHGKLYIYENSIESFTSSWGRIYRILTTHPYESMYKKRELLDYLRNMNFKILKEVDLATFWALIEYFITVVEKK